MYECVCVIHGTSFTFYRHKAALVRPTIELLNNHQADFEPAQVCHVRRVARWMPLPRYEFTPFMHTELRIYSGAWHSAGGLERIAARQLPAKLVALPADARLVAPCRRRARAWHWTRAARTTRSLSEAALHSKWRPVRHEMSCIRINPFLFKVIHYWYFLPKISTNI